MKYLPGANVNQNGTLTGIASVSSAPESIGGHLTAMRRLDSARGKGRSFLLASKLEFDESTIQLGVDGIFARHDSMIANPNNAVFEI